MLLTETFMFLGLLFAYVCVCVREKECFYIQGWDVFKKTVLGGENSCHDHAIERRPFELLSGHWSREWKMLGLLFLQNSFSPVLTIDNGNDDFNGDDVHDHR